MVAQPYSDRSAILIAFCLATSSRSPSLNASFARSTAGGMESREFAAEEIFSRTSSSCVFLKTMPRSSRIFFASLSSAASASLSTTRVSLYEFAPGLLPLPRAGDWTPPLSPENWQVQYCRLPPCRVASGMERDEGIAGKFKPWQSVHAVAERITASPSFQL